MNMLVVVESKTNRNCSTPFSRSCCYTLWLAIGIIYRPSVCL